VWLETSKWTGNISFDSKGSPISLNAGFFEYLDAWHVQADCDPCEAPELAGTAAAGHAGTKWLETSFPMESGDNFEIRFILFDMSEPQWDTWVLLDNFGWSCD